MLESDGMLTEEDKKKVAGWLEAQGLPAPVCPFCGSRDWTIGDHLVQPVTRSSRGLLLGGVGYPQVMLISNKCGHTVYFNAVIIGLLPSGGGAEQKK